MRVAMLRIKERSWEMNTMLPWNSFRKPSSQSMVVMSRWLVGSSSSNTRGELTSARPSAALRSQPPDSEESSASPFRPSCNSTSLMRLSSCQSPW
ncbi:hypothetical protein D3C78_1475180 [compost metagenome]